MANYKVFFIFLIGICRIQDYLDSIKDDVETNEFLNLNNNDDDKSIPKSIECHLYGDLGIFYNNSMYFVNS